MNQIEKKWKKPRAKDDFTLPDKEKNAEEYKKVVEKGRNRLKLTFHDQTGLEHLLTKSKLLTELQETSFTEQESENIVAHIYMIRDKKRRIIDFLSSDWRPYLKEVTVDRGKINGSFDRQDKLSMAIREAHEKEKRKDKLSNKKKVKSDKAEKIRKLRSKLHTLEEAFHQLLRFLKEMIETVPFSNADTLREDFYSLIETLQQQDEDGALSKFDLQLKIPQDDWTNQLEEMRTKSPEINGGEVKFSSLFPSENGSASGRQDIFGVETLNNQTNELNKVSEEAKKSVNENSCKIQKIPKQNLTPHVAKTAKAIKEHCEKQKLTIIEYYQKEGGNFDWKEFIKIHRNIFGLSHSKYTMLF